MYKRSYSARKKFRTKSEVRLFDVHGTQDHRQSDDGRLFVRKRKGLWFPEEEGMTLIFIMLIIIISIIGGLTVLIKGVNGGITYSVEFVPIANKPFALAEVLSRMQFGDRSFLEEAIESSATGSLESAGAGGMISDLRALMKTYGIDNYAVSISGVMGIDSAGERCGTVLDGWCTQSCDVGYVKINAAGACRPSQVCCQPNAEEYKKTSNLQVVPCGTGTCSAGIMKTAVGSAGPVVYLYQLGPFCGDGMNEIDTNACKNANGGATSMCCAPKTEQSVVNTLNRASVPLLFKQKSGQEPVRFLTIEVGVNG